MESQGTPFDETERDQGTRTARRRRALLTRQMATNAKETPREHGPRQVSRDAEQMRDLTNLFAKLACGKVTDCLRETEKKHASDTKNGVLPWTPDCLVPSSGKRAMTSQASRLECRVGVGVVMPRVSAV